MTYPSRAGFMARLARAEAATPRSLALVTITRVFRTPCPSCERDGGARVRFLRATDPDAPGGAYTARCDDAAVAGAVPPGCGAWFLNQRAWDYLAGVAARDPDDARAQVFAAARADGWRVHR